MLKENLSPEEFQALMGKTFKVERGPYAGKQGILMGCMESDNELALKCGNVMPDDMAFPMISEVDPKPV
jgi:hypothetical protein